MHAARALPFSFELGFRDSPHWDQCFPSRLLTALEAVGSPFGELERRAIASLQILGRRSYE
jgi:hypothetical protein